MGWKYFTIILTSLFTLHVFAEPSPIVGTWKGSRPAELTVDISPVKDRIEVTINKYNEQTPESIGITFFDAKGNTTRLKLKTLNPRLEAVRYTGLIAPDAAVKFQSYIGFQVEIPFDPGSTKIVKSNDLKKIFYKEKTN